MNYHPLMPIRPENYPVGAVLQVTCRVGSVSYQHVGITDGCGSVISNSKEKGKVICQTLSDFAGGKRVTINLAFRGGGVMPMKWPEVASVNLMTLLIIIVSILLAQSMEKQSKVRNSKMLLHYCVLVLSSLYYLEKNSEILAASGIKGRFALFCWWGLDYFMGKIIIQKMVLFSRVKAWGFGFC